MLYITYLTTFVNIRVIREMLLVRFAEYYNETQPQVGNHLHFGLVSCQRNSNYGKILHLHQNGSCLRLHLRTANIGNW